MPMTGVSTLSPKIALVLLGLGGISQPCEPQLVSHTLVRLLLASNLSSDQYLVQIGRRRDIRVSAENNIEIIL